MDALEKYLQEKLQDPEFRKAWEESEEEYQHLRKQIKEQIEKNKKAPSS